MVILLTVLTFAIVIALSWMLGRNTQEKPVLASAVIETKPTQELYYHPGLSWVRPRPDGRVTVGTSDFGSRFVGRLAAVELPRVGSHLKQGAPAWVLVSKRGRRLPGVMPVDGIVDDVNYDLIGEPDILSRSPLQLGWCIHVVPDHLEESLRNLLPVRAAGDWMESLKSLVLSKLHSSCGAVAADGGEAVADLGDRLDDVTWEKVAREIIPTGLVRPKQR